MNEHDTETHVEMTAGEMLRNARTTGRRKREIPTISKQLCIREEFLQALEDGDFAVIGETVYVLGFARNYALELGLDPDEIVNKLKREMGLIADSSDDDDDDNAVAENGAGTPGDGACGKGRLTRRAYQYARRRWKWFLGGLIILILAIIALILFVGNGEKNTTVSETGAPVIVATAEPQFNVAVRERFGTENKDDADVILQATQESWVKIEDGRGNTVFSRVLVPGDVYYVPAGDKYKGTFGNAGGIDVWVNGKLAPKVGADHVRKSGISMTPGSLLATASTSAE